jgi:hypothetical protein
MRDIKWRGGFVREPTLFAAVLLLWLLAVPRAAAEPLPAPAAPEPATRARVSETYGRLPLRFEANRGQTDPRVKFLSRGPGYSVFLTSTEAVLVLSKGTDRTALRVTLLDANRAAQVTGHEELPGAVNYLVGNDPSRWRHGIQTYARVGYQDVYPGIDLVYYGNQRQLEYDFVVRAGADPTRIALDFAGAESVEIDSQGDLVLHTAAGELRHKKPVVYQEIDGVRREVAGGYAMAGPGRVKFELARYDASLPLVIDPVLVYSTFLGGSSTVLISPNEAASSIAVDSTGNAYVTGFTTSLDFPTTPGAFDTALATVGTIVTGDVFVTKLDPSGSSLVYSTYIGGNGGDQGTGIAVDAAGNAYVTGLTASTDFPTTPGAFDATHNGSSDAFVAKLDATGSTLLYSTYLGGTGDDRGFAIAVDAGGSAYVTGVTRSANFPTTPGAFDTTHNGITAFDAFVTKLNPTGTALVYSTFLGGTGADLAQGIAVDSSGSAYVTGQTRSANFPTTPGAFDTTLNGLDAFVTKLNATGTALVYSTFLGGTLDDAGNAITVDAAGNAYVAGIATSPDFPTTPGAFSTTNALGAGDAFVTKLDAAGATLVYSTFLGGSGSDAVLSIAIDAAGNAYLTGSTNSPNFPTTSGALDTTLSGVNDAFVAKLDAAGATLLYSTYLGGGGSDAGLAIALDPQGNAYVTGNTSSADFPTTPGAFDRTPNGDFSIFGGSDAFVVKISDIGPPATLALDPAADMNPVQTQHCVTATVRDTSGNPTSGVTVRFTVAGAITTSSSGTTSESGQAAFCYTGPTAPGVDTIAAYADTNGNNTQDAAEPGARADKVWVAGPTATVTVAPANATNPVGTQHCVTATSRDAFGNPTAGIVVRFAVTGTATASGSATTGPDGLAAFCYTGPATAGADAIVAYADTSANDVQDATEPGGAAAKSWVSPAAAPAHVSGGGRAPAGLGTIAFGFQAKSNERKLKGHCNVIDKAADVHVKCLDVTSLVQVGTHATVLGNATINGAATTYRIDIDDLGEPGAGRDVFTIVTGDGYTAGGVLVRGNVQVHHLHEEDEEQEDHHKGRRGRGRGD